MSYVVVSVDRSELLRWQFKTKPVSSGYTEFCRLMYSSRCLSYIFHFISFFVPFRAASCLLAYSSCNKIAILNYTLHLCGWMRCESRKKQNLYLCYQLDEHKFFIDLTTRLIFFFIYIFLFGSALQCRPLLHDKKKSYWVCVYNIYILYIHQKFWAHWCDNEYKSCPCCDLSTAILFLHRIAKECCVSEIGADADTVGRFVHSPIQLTSEMPFK